MTEDLKEHLIPTPPTYYKWGIPDAPQDQIHLQSWFGNQTCAAPLIFQCSLCLVLTTTVTLWTFLICLAVFCLLFRRIAIMVLLLIERHPPSWPSRLASWIVHGCSGRQRNQSQMCGSTQKQCGRWRQQIWAFPQYTLLQPDWWMSTKAFRLDSQDWWVSWCRNLHAVSPITVWVSELQAKTSAVAYYSMVSCSLIKEGCGCKRGKEADLQERGVRIEGRMFFCLSLVNTCRQHYSRLW